MFWNGIDNHLLLNKFDNSFNIEMKKIETMMNIDIGFYFLTLCEKIVHCNLIFFFVLFSFYKLQFTQTLVKGRN